MDTVAILVYLVYCAIGLFVFNKWWERQSEKDRENAEKGTVCIVMLVILAVWPIKLIYDYIKKKML